MQSYISTIFLDEPYVLDAAISWIRNMVLDLQVINEQNYFGIWDDPKIQKLKIMIGFTKNIPRILAHQSGLHKDLTKINNLYEHTSHLILAIISGAASVQNPPYLCWKIQYELTWLPLFCDPILEKEEHWRNIRLIVEEAICKKIVDIGAIGWKVNRTDIKFLGYFLNVTGLASTKFDNDPNVKLNKKIQEWLVSNYDQLWKNENGDIGKFSLVGGMISYSPQKILIVEDNHPIFPGEKLQINQA